MSTFTFSFGLITLSNGTTCTTVAGPAPAAAAVAERTLGVRGHPKMTPAEAAADLGIDPEEAARLDKSALFRLRMLFGKARKEAEEAAEG